MHNSVARFDHLAELRVSELRYDSTRSGKELEPCDDEVCIGIRIVRYEVSDRFRVFDTRRVGLTDAQVESLLRALPERTRKGHPIRDLFAVA